MPLDQPVRASELQVVVSGIREITTVSWNSGEDIRMPVAIAELGLGDLTWDPPPTSSPMPADPTCCAVDGVSPSRRG